QVNKLYIDKKNRLWIATYGGGVSIYDGISFQTLNKKNGLSNNIVWDFAEDSEGNMWIGTDDGVSIFNGESFTYITEKDSLKSSFAWCVYKDSKNRMWIGTSKGGAARYENGKLTTFFLDDDDISNDQVYSILEDSKGNMWFGTHSGGLIKYNGKEFKNFRFSTKGENIIRSIHESSRGKIYCATLDGLVVVEKDSAIILKINSGNYNYNRMYNIYEDENDIFWISTMGGMARYDEISFQLFGIREGLPDNILRAIVKDQWGNFWVGTSMEGILKFKINGFINYTKKSGFPSESANCIFHDTEHNTWIATNENGLLKYDGRKFIHFNEENGFKWKHLTCITEDKDKNIWIGTETDGILKYDGSRFYQYTKAQGLSNQRITAMEILDNGELWIATQWSVNRWVNDSITFYNNNNGIAHFFIITLKKDNAGHLWMGTYGGGATYYDGNFFYNFNDSSGLSNNNVLSIETDRFGNVWFSCFGEGINILKSGWSKEKSKPVWKNFGSENGLADDAVAFVRTDKEWNIWIGSKRGLQLIESKNTDIFKKDPVIKHIGFDEGFTGMECITNGFCADNEKSIWIPTHKLLTRFYYKKFRDSEVAPFLILNSLKLNLEKVNWKLFPEIRHSGIDKWNNVPLHPEFPWHHNHLHFSFTGICYDHPEEVEYQWKMEGFDPKWSPWSKAHEVTYSNLPPGNFTLKIKARNAAGVVSKEFDYSFIIHKPWWQTWWFRITVIILSLAVIIIAFRMRTRTLRKRQEILEKTVEERTEEIVKQKEIIEEKHREITDSINYAERIQRALMSGETILKRYVKDYFIYFNPKEAVSGDFYW
ncbi:MAG: two-component regulator propeller domain-containing protein, partial [Bacteroidota bacterium]